LWRALDDGPLDGRGYLLGGTLTHQVRRDIRCGRQRLGLFGDRHGWALLQDLLRHL
jgi:hypothetical protein